MSEHSGREVDEFARELAHEMRTSINQVAAIAELLLDHSRERPEADRRELLEIQLVAARRMDATVCDLLEMARCNHAPLAQEDIDLSALCERLRDELEGQSHRAPVQWHIQPAMRLCGGLAHVAVLMRNLLSNAVKYTRDSAHPRIDVSAEQRDDGLWIRVKDNGAGFDPAATARLFQPFVRLHDRDAFDGTGLGLSLVRRAVDRHGGRIVAQGRPGQGACFEFTLGPCEARARPAVAGHARRALHGHEGCGEAAPGDAGSCSSGSAL